MIWIGPIVLCFLCIILTANTAAQMSSIRRERAKMIRREADAPSEGPARLELFGHVTHIGWVRQGAERIDLLTIEGEALQCDTRARYRLTPLTWREFVAECLRRKEERTKQDRANFDHALAALEDLKHKHKALRENMVDASNLLAESAIALQSPEMCRLKLTEAHRLLADGLERDDAIPF